MNKNIALIGAGGHAKVVLEALLLNNANNQIDVYDDDQNKRDSYLLGIQVNVPIKDCSRLPDNIHIAIGDNLLRKTLGEKAIENNKNYILIIHPSAIVSKYSHISQGVFVGAGAIIAAETFLNNGVIINHNAVIDHDCFIGSWTHIAPGVILGGGVKIGKNCLIGAGAIILPGVHIADHAVVAAGAVVTRNVEEGKTVIGIPARNNSAK